MQYEAEEKRKVDNIPTAKDLREARERAEARLKREQEAALKVDVAVRQCEHCSVVSFIDIFEFRRKPIFVSMLTSSTSMFATRFVKLTSNI